METQETLGALAKAFGEQSPIVAFVFGALVIAYYASQRLAELVDLPNEAEFSFVAKLTLPLLVGRDVYRRSYFIYLFALEFLYVALCSFEPLVGVFQSSTAPVKLDNATWPIVAALLIVGLLPNTIIAQNIEKWIRHFAREIVDDPDNFYNSVVAIDTQTIEKIANEAGPRYAHMLAEFHDTTHIMLVIGLDPVQAVRKARKCLGLKLFGQWVLDGREYWTNSEYRKYKEVRDHLRTDYDRLAKQLDSLLAETLEHEPFDRKEKNGYKPSAAASETRVTAWLSSSPSEDGKARFAELKEKWLELALQCENSSRGLIALFSILARNDRRIVHAIQAKTRSADGSGAESGVASNRYAAHIDDNAFEEFILLEHAKRTGSGAWFNSLLYNTFIAGIVAAVSYFSFRWIAQSSFILSRLNEYLPLKLQPKTVDEWLQITVADTVAMGFAFWVGSVAALFWRSARISDDDWTPFNPFNIATSQYFSVLLGTALACFPALMTSYVGYYFLTPPCATKACDSVLLPVIFTNVGLALAIATVSVGICIVTDVTEDWRHRWAKDICLRALAISSLFALAVLVMSKGYTEQPVYLISQLLLFVVFAALLLYGYASDLRRRTVMATREIMTHKIQQYNSKPVSETAPPENSGTQ